MMMEIVSWIVVGTVAGCLAGFAMPGPAAGGIRVAVLIGVVSAMTGGLVATAFRLPMTETFDMMPLGIAANGALYSLFIYRCAAMRLEPVYGRTG
jgi:uncharacterized membrane protein YeaQ/YmgE (transglycosylase-associated protein family)